MIALVTSTLIPSYMHSFFDPAERLEQSIITIKKLQAFGFSDIYFFDNSVQDIDREALIKAYDHIKIFRSPQYSFNNKGLNEALLILNNIHHLPANTPIFKISGRYYPNDDFKVPGTHILEKYDIAGAGTDLDKKNSAFNTRGYFVRNKQALENIMVLAVEEMIAYSRGVHGPRSLLKSLKGIFKPVVGAQYHLSIEQALANIVKAKNNYYLIDRINIDGYLAGTTKQEFIKD